VALRAATLFCSNSNQVSTKHNRTQPLPALACAGLVVSIFLLVGVFRFHSTGFGGHFGGEADLFFVSDAREYRAIADYLYGGTVQAPSLDLLSLRTLGYPVFLGLYRWVGIACFQLLQLALEALTIGALTHSLFRHIGWFAAIAGVVLTALPSPTFLCYRALSEPLSIALACLFLSALLNRSLKQHWAILLLGCLCIVKPSFQPALLVGLLALVMVWVRAHQRQLARTKRTVARSLLFGVVPLLFQWGITAAIVGKPLLNSAAALNFEWRFFPAMAAEAELHDWRLGAYSTDFAKQKRQAVQGVDQVFYLLGHPKATARGYYRILVEEHLTRASSHVQTEPGASFKPSPSQHRAQQKLRETSRKLNRWMAVCHVLFLPIALVMLRATRTNTALRVASYAWWIAFSIIVTAPLVYWQGDRVIVAAVPFWATCYAIWLYALAMRGKAFVLRRMGR